jgi:hypothetical protein
MSAGLAEAAAFLCQQWPVFPCDSEKRPVTPNGYKNAVTDPDAARRLFRTPGAALIGVPTGPEADLAVVDLDVKNGGAGLEWLAANEARLPRTRRHRTRSGGLHLIFRYPAGRRVRNSVSKLAPGVDIRGAGGYIIVPPSTGYEIADDAMPAVMPGWLIELLDPPQVVRPVPQMPRGNLGSADGTPYGLGALDRECAAVAGAPPGTQEVTLNNAGLKLGALVAGQELARAVAVSSLVGAGLQMAAAAGERSWSTDEVRRKVERAVADGMAAPRTAPIREVRHTVRIEFGSPEVDAPWPDEVPEHLAAEPDPTPEPEAEAEAKPAGGLPVLRFEDITPALDTADFVQGLLVEGSAAVVYGESNAGKTFWATDLSLHVAAGLEWNGKRVEQGGVVYCVLEGGSGFRNRVSAWRTDRGLDDASIPFSAIPATLNLLDPEADTPRLIAAIKAEAARMGCPVKLVVIDTLSRAFAGGNENASEDMGRLVANMDLIRAETGACVMFIHHSGKDQAKGARGHSSLRAAIDTELEVAAEPGSDLKTATLVKQRELAKGAVFAFRLDVIELGKNRHGEPVTTCLVRPIASDDVPVPRKRLTPSAREAFAALREGLAKYGATVPMREIPEGMPVIALEQWRAEFYSRSTRDNAEANKKAFQNGTKDLIQAGLVGFLLNRAWIARAD